MPHATGMRAEKAVAFGSVSSLTLNFLICKMGTIASLAEGCKKVGKPGFFFSMNSHLTTPHCCWIFTCSSPTALGFSKQPSEAFGHLFIS